MGTFLIIVGSVWLFCFIWDDIAQRYANELWSRVFSEIITWIFALGILFFPLIMYFYGKLFL